MGQLKTKGIVLVENSIVVDSQETIIAELSGAWSRTSAEAFCYQAKGICKVSEARADCKV